MISTVTTTTVTTVTAMMGFGVVMGVIAVVALLAFLCTRELAAASRDSKHRLLAKSLDIGIVPLLITFVMIAVMTVLGM